MYRIAWPLKYRKVPVAAGLVAAFGSIWLTCKDQFYLTNSYSSFLWNYFVPGFLKNGYESAPERRPNPFRKLPNIKICSNEKLVSVNKGFVSHYETNNLASNEPIEDRHSEYDVHNGLLFGVFDGHSGWQCAEEVMRRLPYYVALSSFHAVQGNSVNIEKISSVVNSLQGNFDKNITKSYGTAAKKFHNTMKVKSVENVSVEQQLKTAYKLLDQDIVYEAMPREVNYQIEHEEMLKGLSGACAITAYIKDRDLYIANAGDCRAVLGSKTANGHWLATPLSVDQNALNIEEVKRLKLEHPEENFVVLNSRLLGMLQPFRAFGDVMFKWDYQLHEEILNKMYNRVLIPLHLYRSPPYLTAEPVVTHHKLQSEDKFLLVATDGLWDMLSNESAVQCIGELIDNNSLALPERELGEWKTNGTSQLIQLALGGNDEAKVSTMLSAPKHIRRALRDDITITIVYFTPVN